MSHETKFKAEFLRIMQDDYLLDPVEVEDFVDRHLEDGLVEAGSPRELATQYAEKYDLDSKNSVSFGYAPKISRK